MSFFKIDTSKEVLKDDNFSFINKSGIYPITINTISVETNDKEARSLNINYTYEGSQGVLYGLRLDNNDGTPNFGSKIFNKLCVIAGITEVHEPETQTHMLGKDKVPTDLQVLDQFSDLEIKTRVQFVYTRYNGKIYERQEIRNFYRSEDNATASEIINDTEKGIQLTKDLKYAEQSKYKDGITEEEIEAWKQAKSSNNIPAEAKGQTTTTPQTNPFAKK